MTGNQRAVLALAGQRLAELAWSKRNEGRMAARGGRRCANDRYGELVGFHSVWLAALWWAARRPAAPARMPLVLVLIGQALRYWSMASLGERWSTRVVVVPDEPLIRRGPYRWLRHPNYVGVALEVAAGPLVVRNVGLAVAGSVAKVIVLRHRITAEEACLRGEHDSC